MHRPFRLLALLLALAATALVACQQQPPLDVLGQAPDFQLVDQTGAPYGSADLAGRAALVDFIYTNCADACPILSANLAKVQSKLRDQQLLGTKVVLVSVSVDPQHDTPAVLSQYAASFQADTAGWRFLTGDWDQVYDVVAGFKVAPRVPRPAPDAPAPGGFDLTHSTRVVLIDPKGQVRAYLQGLDDSPDTIVTTTKRALS